MYKVPAPHFYADPIDYTSKILSSLISDYFPDLHRKRISSMLPNSAQSMPSIPAARAKNLKKTLNNAELKEVKMESWLKASLEAEPHT